MDRYVPISEAADALGVSITTLRRWEVEGKLIPERTAGRQRRYDLAKLKPELFHAAPQDRKTIAYARVSSHEQRTIWNGRSEYLNCIAPSKAGRLKLWPI